MTRRYVKPLATIVFSALLAACGSAPRAPVTPSPAPSPATPASNGGSRLPALPAAGSGHGGYYQDDGPGDHPPEGLLDLPDAIPKVEPYSPTGNKPYVVFGKTYVPITDDRPFKQRGTGSWYGKKFHGQKTSSGELYDMYKLTAAHPTLPIPSYARVTNLGNGAQVIVRINDRGPFHSARIIDLSYTAALKLGYLGSGSSQLEVERLLPDDIARINAARKDGSVVQTAPAPMPAAPAVVPQEMPAAESAAPPAMAPSATPSMELVDPASGFYLQFGAYAELGNADAERARLQQNWGSALPPLEVYFVGLFYRLHSGPFATREEAQAAAQKLLAIGNIKAMVVGY
ncbi:MAG: septal ring lytic transglycosylase RlpA family protein [Burkholderiaceae bacterium]|nr:septal ring lytic transglycosylase RlpA family protein [Burkholderiaceae bacterium]